MKRLAVVVALLALGGCSFFATPPKLPDPPAGAETVTGDGAWEQPYDIAYLDWHHKFEERRPFDSNDYWLTGRQPIADVLVAYDAAFAGWNRREHQESRNRWIEQVYEKDGQLVAVAIFPKARHLGPYDILRVLSAPARP